MHMKKWIALAIVAAFAWACDAPNQSAERGAGSESVERSPVDPSGAESESDEAPEIHRDSTTTGGVNQQGQYDTVR